MGNAQKLDIPVYQLKVTLKGSKPPIWRRIQVRGDISLGRLHDILQIVMGWTDTHLHQFIIGRNHYGVPDPDNPEHEDMLEWVGGEFEPEAFDLDSINQVLKRIR